MDSRDQLTDTHAPTDVDIATRFFAKVIVIAAVALLLVLLAHLVANAVTPLPDFPGGDWKEVT